MKIPIKKHTKVRRPYSRYFFSIDKQESFQLATSVGTTPSVCLELSPTLVQDISKGLEDPLYCNGIYEGEELLATSVGFAPKHQKGDWNENEVMDSLKDIFDRDMKRALEYGISEPPSEPKPSLLTRVKNWRRR